MAFKKETDFFCQACWGGDFGKKIIGTLVGVLLVYLTFYVGTLMRNELKKYNTIGVADQMERTLTVNGFGKVSGANNIAVTTIGYSTTDKDVAKAQQDNKKVMDGVMADLKVLGVADSDLETDYTIYPDYNYTTGKGQVFLGYKVTDTVKIKIRDLKKISDVLSLAGKYGANQVNGLTFTIDDPQGLQAQARDKAVADARQKAKALAQSLGVSLQGVISYNEAGADQPPAPMMYKAMNAGMGGGPIVASGSNDVTMNVTITYKIVPLY